MFLTETQQSTLRAALERIIPPDAWPGAWEAGVGDYIVRLCKVDFPSLQALYNSGLDGLNAESRSRFTREFAALDAVEQDALLGDVESGLTVSPWPIEPRGFFTTIVNHAAEGYYADPGQGGNRGARSWAMIGFDTRAEGDAGRASGQE